MKKERLIFGFLKITWIGFFFLFVFSGNHLFAEVVTFKNTYMENGKKKKEAFVLSRERYERRNKKVLVEGNTYFVKKDTFLEINPRSFLKRGFVLIGKKRYYKKYYLFVNASLELKIASEHEEKLLRIVVDDFPPDRVLHFYGKSHWLKDDVVLILPQTKAEIFLYDIYEVASAEMFLNGKKIGSEETLEFSKPTNTLTLLVKDALENVLSEKITVIVDEKPPEFLAFVEGFFCGLADLKNPTNNTLITLPSNKKGVRLSVRTTEKTDKIFFRKEDAQASFKVWRGNLFVSKGASFWFYAQDVLGNTTAIKKLSFQKKKSQKSLIKVR